jgi:hypothetical protein
MIGLYKLYFHKVYFEFEMIKCTPKPSYCIDAQRTERMSRRRCRSLGRTFSTRLTISDADTVNASANSRIAVKDGLNLARSRRLIYFGWYPLSKPNCSCVKPRRSRSSTKTVANARFSGVLGTFLLVKAAIGSVHVVPAQHIVLQSILSQNRRTVRGY